MHVDPQDWMPRVLERLREGWTLSHAAKAAGVDRSTVFRKREADPTFNAQVRAAIEEGLDTAEDAIRRHWKRDWRAAQATLQSRRAEVWGKQRLELTGKDGGPIETARLSDAERAARLSALLAKAQRQAELDKELEDLM